MATAGKPLCYLITVKCAISPKQDPTALTWTADNRKSDRLAARPTAIQVLPSCTKYGTCHADCTELSAPRVGSTGYNSSVRSINNCVTVC